MSIAEAHTISELLDHRPPTQQFLAQRLRLEKSTVSRLVNELVSDDTVRRRPNPDDQHSVLVELTPARKVRAERLRDARTELFASLLADLSPRTRNEITESLSPSTRRKERRMPACSFRRSRTAWSARSVGTLRALVARTVFVVAFVGGCSAVPVGDARGATSTRAGGPVASSGACATLAPLAESGHAV